MGEMNGNGSLTMLVKVVIEVLLALELPLKFIGRDKFMASLLGRCVDLVLRLHCLRLLVK